LRISEKTTMQPCEKNRRGVQEDHYVSEADQRRSLSSAIGASRVRRTAARGPGELSREGSWNLEIR
jgi:hypothetical protein